MPYNPALAARLREKLEHLPNVVEKEMFGGLCFMVDDKLCMGIVKDEIMCRINPELTEEALEKNGVRPMDFTGKSMKGFIFVNDEGMRTDKQFNQWVNLCVEFNAIANASPKKKKKKK